MIFTLRQGLGFEKLPERAQSWPTSVEAQGTPTIEPSSSASAEYNTKPGFFNNVDGWLASNHRKGFYRRNGKLLPFRGSAQVIPAHKRTHIACHITAVHFGTTRSRRAFWATQIPNMPEDVREMYWDGSVESTATRLALHERFWRVPYHVVGLRNGDILHNNHLDSYTFHGDLLNDESIGLASEAILPGLASSYKPGSHTKLDDFYIQTNRKAFQVAYELAMEKNMPIQGVRCHRQADSNRVSDPGEQYYKLVLRPMAERLGLKIDIAYKTGSGLPIAHEWDERSTVNFRGRPL